MKWMMIAVLAVAGVAFAGEPDAKAVDAEAYRAATERLAAKAATSKPVAEMDVNELRIENAALRQRISELENILGIKNGPTVTRPSRTFSTFQEVINAAKYPADPRKDWTDLQRAKAQHDLNAAVAGCQFQATMKLDRAQAKNGEFRCTFSRTNPDGREELIFANFDARYSDLITSWKVGQSISFIGTIQTAELTQRIQERSGLKVFLSLSDCTPKK